MMQLKNDEGHNYSSRSEELDDLKFGIEQFAKHFAIIVRITYEKKRILIGLKEYQKSS